MFNWSCHAARDEKSHGDQSQPSQNCTDNDGTAQRRAVSKLRIDDRGDFQNATHVAELPILLWRFCECVVTVDTSLHHHGICQGHTHNVPSVKDLLTEVRFLWPPHQKIPGLLLECIELLVCSLW